MEEKWNSKAVGAVILGITGVILSFFWGWLGTVLGIIGIVLAVSSRKECSSILGIAGLILSVIAVLFGVLFFVACTVCVSFFGMTGQCNF